MVCCATGQRRLQYRIERLSIPVPPNAFTIPVDESGGNVQLRGTHVLRRIKRHTRQRPRRSAPLFVPGPHGRAMADAYVLGSDFAQTITRISCFANLWRRRAHSPAPFVVAPDRKDGDRVRNSSHNPRCVTDASARRSSFTHHHVRCSVRAGETAWPVRGLRSDHLARNPLQALPPTSPRSLAEWVRSMRRGRAESSSSTRCEASNARWGLGLPDTERLSSRGERAFNSQPCRGSGGIARSCGLLCLGVVSSGELWPPRLIRHSVPAHCAADTEVSSAAVFCPSVCPLRERRRFEGLRLC